MSQPRELRRLNRQAITQLLFAGTGLTRPQLAAQTGLSKVSVNVVVQELLTHGIVQLTISPEQRLGRTPQRVQLQAQIGAVLAVDLQPTQIHTQLSGLAGGSAATERRHCTEAGLTPTLLDALERALVSPLYGPLRHVLIGLPAPVDPQGRVREPNGTPHLDLPGVTAFLDRAGVSHAFANDANLVALAVTRDTPGRSHLAVLLERPSGTGMGLLLDGKLYRGVQGRAGEIGRSRWPSGHDAVPLETLPDPERLDATAYLLAGLVHTLDLQQVVLGLSQERAAALQHKLNALLDQSITTHLLPDVDGVVLRGAAHLAREQAREQLLARVENLRGDSPDVA